MKQILLISSILITAGAAMAQGFASQQYDTGTVGIKPGQTAKFNVLYPTIPTPAATQILCSANLVIADDQGATLKALPVPQLVPGKSVSVDLNADTDLPSGSGRVQIHAFAVTPGSGSTGAGCMLVATLEMIDNTSGKTLFVLGGQKTWGQAQILPYPVASSPAR